MASNDSARLREFIKEFFNDKELTDFCLDYFTEAHDEFTRGMYLSEKVNLLVDMVENDGRLPDLHRALKSEKRTAYDNEFPQGPPPAPAPAPAPSPVQTAPSETSAQPPAMQSLASLPPPAWAAIGAVVVIIFVIILWPRGEGNAAALPTSTQAVAAVVTGTASPTSAPTATAEPTAVPSTPTTEPTPEPTDIPPTPTDEPTPEPTATAVPPTPTDAPTVEPATAVPTIAYPDGQRLELTYNASSFYLYNPSRSRVLLLGISFEALDSAGRPLRYSAAGDGWTQIYRYVDGTSCTEFRVFGMEEPWMRPAYCRQYNATVSLENNAVEIFWVEREEAVAFRVMYADEEIARCPLGSATCDIYVPAP